MKIVHLCLTGQYTDGYTYQDNLLTKYHKILDNEVTIITSLYSRNKNAELVKNEKSSYFNEENVKVNRIENKYKTTITSRFRLYKNLYKEIEKENPDVLFIHGLQFLNIISVKKYLKNNPQVVAYADNHADFSNSASNWLSLNILHKFIWKKCAHYIEPYLKRIYGVIPARVDFLKNVYKLPKEKIELLLLGADDEKVKKANLIQTKKKYREYKSINDDDFLIVTGGKIDQAKKQTLLLMKAVKKIENKKVKLIVFGPVVDELKKEFMSLVDNETIKYISWVDGNESYNYFGAADLVVFPGRHSVYWEQVAGLGRPMLLKYWKGTTHLDVGGNCEFLYQDDTNEIKNKINELVYTDKYKEMLKTSKEKGMKEFSYFQIAKKSISEN